MQEANTYPGGLSADATHEVPRPSVPALDSLLGHSFPVLDHGHIRVIDYMGDEGAILQAARVSYGKGTESVSSDRGLLRYLLRHRHTTPFEMCEIKLHVKLPVFVARQWIRHRTANVNEYSARYSILAREFHVPEVTDLAPQSTSNKQGRAGSYDLAEAAAIQAMMRESCDQSFNVYDALIYSEDTDDGIIGTNLARETAREVLPMNTYTEWYWKTDLHNLLHFLSLRADPHAQKEIRDYAEVMCKLVSAWVPHVWEAFEDYRLGAHTFSKQEMAVIRDIISGHGFTKTHFQQIGGLSKREQTAFFEALGVSQEAEA